MGIGSGEIELIDSRWISSVSSTHALKLLQNITKYFYNFSSKIWYFWHWNRLKTTKNSGGNMYESFGLIGIQLPEKYKENFDVSSEGASTCTVRVCIHRTWPFILSVFMINIRMRECCLHREQTSRVYLVKQDKHHLTLLILVYCIV
jgi:hypothetical protein